MNQCIMVGGKAVYLTVMLDFIVMIALMILGNETGWVLKNIACHIISNAVVCWSTTDNSGD